MSQPLLCAIRPNSESEVKQTIFVGTRAEEETCRKIVYGVPISQELEART
jgi:hypothetical protein